MAVVQGNVEVKVNVTGAGNASAVVDKTTEAIARTEEASDGVGKSLLGMREKFTQVAGVASSALGQITGEVGAVTSAVVETGSKFGALGIVAGGLVGVIGGIWAGLNSLSQQRFDMVTKSLQGTADAAGALARSLATAATKANELKGAMTSAEVRALTAQIASARARGDTNTAVSLTSQLTLLQSGNEAGALRQQGADAFYQSANATAQRAAALAQVADTEAKIRTLEGKLAQKAVVEFRNGVAMSREDLQAELAGLQALRVQQVGNAALVSPQATVDNARAATEILKAATAVEAQGIVESVTGAINNAVSTLKDGLTDKGRPKGGGLGARAAAVDQSDSWGLDLTTDGEARSGRRRGGGLGGIVTRDRVAGGQQRSAIGRMAEDVRAFGVALSEIDPSLAAFTKSLETIGTLWKDWAKGSVSTKNAVVGSLGAIGLAGAEQIKNTQLRMGIESLLYLGLGTAHVLTPGMEAQGAAELAGAGILAAKAIFGGSSGGSRGSGGSSRAPRQVRSDNITSGAIVININGSYYGAHTPQESAAGFARLISRADGTGFGARG